MIQNLLFGGIIFVGYKFYQWTKCPKELEHLPAVGFIDFIKYTLDNNQYSDKAAALQPLFNEYGVVRVYHFIILIKLCINIYLGI
jgi:hypothetical protein